MDTHVVKYKFLHCNKQKKIIEQMYGNEFDNFVYNREKYLAFLNKVVIDNRVEELNNILEKCREQADETKHKPLKHTDMKFKVGDTIRNKITGREYTIGVVTDELYWLVGYGRVPVENAESSYELVEQPKFHLPALEHNFGLSDYKKMWDEHILQMITEITNNNTQAFVGIIDNMLRCMDCDGVRDDVRLGYRKFADELKKQLLCNDIKTD